MSRIAKLHQPELVGEFSNDAQRLREELLLNAIDGSRGCLVADYGGTEVDAALLQAVTLGLLPSSDSRLHATVDAVSKDLGYHGWLKRYRTDDGFGAPTVAFMLCTFWLIDALVRLGSLEKARSLMEQIRNVKSPLGLLSEDFDPVSNAMWGNFPQAYSHVGMIHAAFAASPRWSEMGS
jgi:GH15 family glucan-1,4-alpha-glucosidase